MERSDQNSDGVQTYSERQHKKKLLRTVLSISALRDMISGMMYEANNRKVFRKEVDGNFNYATLHSRRISFRLKGPICTTSAAEIPREISRPRFCRFG